MYSIYNIRAKLGSGKEKMVGVLDTVIDPIDGDKDEPPEFEEEESELHADLQKQAKMAQIEKEEFAKMDRSLQCPSRFLKPLRHQTRMSDPSLHVKHMKFRLKSPSGFIGRKLLMDICKEAYPIGIQKDLETYARMIFWLVGCMNPKWRGLYIDFRDTVLAVQWYIAENKDPFRLLQWLFRMCDYDGSGKIPLEKLPELVGYVVEVCGIQNEEMLQTNVEEIMACYDSFYEDDIITEEEFIFDSLDNDPFFTVLKNTNITMLHLENEGFSHWTDTIEEDANETPIDINDDTEENKEALDVKEAETLNESSEKIQKD